MAFIRLKPRVIIFTVIAVASVLAAAISLVRAVYNAKAVYAETVIQPMKEGPEEKLYKKTSAPDTSLVSAESSQTQQVRFVESAELMLPSLKENLQFGQPFHLRGTILSYVPLKSIKVTILNEKSTDPIYPCEAMVTLSAAAQVKSYSFEDTKDNVAAQIHFDKLQPGYNTLIITASTFVSDNVPVAASGFFVNEPSEWLQLISNNFRDNYSAALKFFVRKDHFLFKYKWTKGRRIVIDPVWVKTYIVTIPGIGNKKWKVHADAVPYVKKALEYLNNTYIRVKGNGHDSGVVKLVSLVKSYNGAYVSRYVTDKSFISHHAFGTALDINAYISPNKNKLANHDNIHDEITNCLNYNGTEESKGIKYYDFNYNGKWKEYYRDVPTSVLNYLLYELAFYRAGFGWGYYYSYTCDAMHFTLTELDTSAHSDATRGLRKVYDYI